MVTATPTGRAATGAAPGHSPGAGCTRPTSGDATCGRRSSCVSRSAVSVRSKDSVFGQQMLTTSSTTRGTGRGSATAAILRACATAVTAGKRRRNCTKTADVLRGELRHESGRLGRSSAARERRAEIFAEAAQGRKCSGRGRLYRRHPDIGDFFPTGKWRKRRCAAGMRRNQAAERDWAREIPDALPGRGKRLRRDRIAHPRGSGAGLGARDPWRSARARRTTAVTLNRASAGRSGI